MNKIYNKIQMLGFIRPVGQPNAINNRIDIMQNRENNTSSKKVTSKHPLRYSDFEFIRVLGMGAYGKVQLVQRKGIKYAMKIIQKRILAKQGKQYQAFIQRQLLRKMSHPGVVALKTCFQDRKNLYFCLQYCEGGDFITFINNNQWKMTNQLRVFYLAEIVSIIEYLQEIKVVHRDLKPENILLSQRGHLKLIDFATAQISDCPLIDKKFRQQLLIHKNQADQKQFPQFQNQLKLSTSTMKDSETKSQMKSQTKSETQSQPEQPEPEQTPLPAVRRRKATFVGTCYYVPPQLLQEQVCFPATDLWALGCIMYQLYYLVPPFDGSSQYEVFEKIKNLEYSFPKNPKVTEHAKDLMTKLLQRNPQDRLGSNSRQGLMLSDLKAHKFFQGVDFSNIFQQVVPVLDEQTNQKDNQRLSKQGDQIMKQYLSLLQNNTNIVIHGAIQKRTFINYNVYYLIVFKNLKMLRIKVSQPGKTRQTSIQLIKKIEGKDNLPAQFLSDTMFKLVTKQKTYKFKTSDPGKWVEAINQTYRHLRQGKGEGQGQQGEIQKQCKSISEMLKNVKIVIQQ